jgi:hypothetical protein
MQDEMNKDQNFHQMKNARIAELEDRVEMLTKDNENLNKLLVTFNERTEYSSKTNRELEEMYSTKLKEFKSTYEMMMKSQLEIELQKKMRERDDNLMRYESELSKMRILVNDYQKRLVPF